MAPVFNYGDGFPLNWGNPYQKTSDIPGGQIAAQVRDLAVNQIPWGHSNEVPLRQVLLPKTAQTEGPGTDPSQNVGSYGSNLYDAFMAPYVEPQPQQEAG